MRAEDAMRAVTVAPGRARIRELHGRSFKASPTAGVGPGQRPVGSATAAHSRRTHAQTPRTRMRSLHCSAIGRSPFGRVIARRRKMSTRADSTQPTPRRDRLDLHEPRTLACGFGRYVFGHLDLCRAKFSRKRRRSDQDQSAERAGIDRGARSQLRGFPRLGHNIIRR